MENKSAFANPAPLGLLGFGLTTVLLNLANAHIIEISSMILAMGLAYGGFAQLVAGIMEFKTGNTFGFVAFISYATFWWSFVLLLILPILVPGFAGPSASGLAAYLIMWGILTLGLFFGTFKTKVTMLVFLTLFILFFLLAACQFHPGLTIITGYEGILCGALAIYDGLAQVINGQYGRKILPL
ncbi:MAG: acetate uptake transporter [Fusobacteria bacterium]|nr:acetate uptake transporter [Fusobacteriota bacterium]